MWSILSPPSFPCPILFSRAVHELSRTSAASQATRASPHKCNAREELASWLVASCQLTDVAAQRVYPSGTLRPATAVGRPRTEVGRGRRKPRAPVEAGLRRVTGHTSPARVAGSSLVGSRCSFKFVWRVSNRARLSDMLSERHGARASAPEFAPPEVHTSFRRIELGALLS